MSAKTPKIKPKSKSKVPTNESKSDKFLRVAKPRVQKILKAIRLLGNCSNRSNYEYTEQQITKIFTTVDNALNLTEKRFTKSKTEFEKFDF